MFGDDDHFIGTERQPICLVALVECVATGGQKKKKKKKKKRADQGE